MRVAVIVPVGPGHAVDAERALASVRRAWTHDPGPFSTLDIAPVMDLAGELGRSRARNLGMDTHPADWHFLLDADDEMTEEAFSLLDLAVPATFGAIRFHPRIPETIRAHAQNHPGLVTRRTLFELGARGTLCMGCFVRGDLGLRFDESLDIAEDFDFYLRLPGWTKHAEPLVYVGYDRPSADGPRGFGAVDWIAACDRVVARHHIRDTHPGLRRTEVGNYYDPHDPGDPSYPRRSPRRSVTEEECVLLAQLARDRRVLEIGTGLGVSAGAMALTAEHVTTVDSDPWVQDPGLANGTFLRRTPSSETHCGAYNLAFVDGCHRRDAVIADVTACLALRIHRLLLHDTHLPEVQAAIQALGIREVRSWPTAGRIALFYPLRP